MSGFIPKTKIGVSPEPGFIVLVFRSKYSVLVSLMSENVQNTQLRVSGGPELLVKAFLPGVTYLA